MDRPERPTGTHKWWVIDWLIAEVRDLTGMSFSSQTPSNPGFAVVSVKYDNLFTHAPRKIRDLDKEEHCCFFPFRLLPQECGFMN